ncbi:MAG TPA: prolyl oligopeptidase family serine peptidase [Burkholderiaceae bacterium]|nr:prolyl oligopeptidase family serine peptidase [Burkholderiaceae bacterium]
MTTGDYWLTVDGVPREYLVKVPASYDPNKRYKLIFAFHPRWGGAWDIAIGGFYGMEQQYGEDAIYVAPQGLVDSDPGLEDATGWKNTSDRDIHFVRGMVDNIKQNLCVDNQRVYAMGFSYGGMMSNAIGCGMADVFRGISAAAGALKSGCADSSNEVAAIMFHSTDDYFVTYPEGEQARDIFLARNHCSPNSITVGQHNCQLYLGCDGNKAVAWCPRDEGGHSAPPYFAEETKVMWDYN